MKKVSRPRSTRKREASSEEDEAPVTSIISQVKQRKKTVGFESSLLAKPTELKKSNYLDSFTKSSISMSEQVAMDKFIESELEKKRPQKQIKSDEKDKITELKNELYKIPDHLKVKQYKNEGDVASSTGMLNSIQEVDLSIIDKSADDDEEIKFAEMAQKTYFFDHKRM